MKKLKPSCFLPCPAQLGNWGRHSLDSWMPILLLLWNSN